MRYSIGGGLVVVVLVILTCALWTQLEHNAGRELSSREQAALRGGWQPPVYIPGDPILLPRPPGNPNSGPHIDGHACVNIGKPCRQCELGTLMCAPNILGQCAHAGGEGRSGCSINAYAWECRPSQYGTCAPANVTGNAYCGHWANPGCAWYNPPTDPPGTQPTCQAVCVTDYNIPCNVCSNQK